MFEGRRVIFANPTNDHDFVAFATSSAERSETPERLQLALRAKYPGATVRARVLDGEMSVVWYVYREGKWTSGAGDGDVRHDR